MNRLAVCLSLFIMACGGDSLSKNGDAGATGSYTLDSGATVQCLTAEHCLSGTVCAPNTHTCVADLACTTHASCGKAGYCTAEKKCARSSTGSPCENDDNCASGDTCRGGFCGCEGQTYGSSKVPPNVLLVLDRSSSMNQQIGGKTKWNMTKEAVAALLAAKGNEIRFGLALFPSASNQCSQGGAVVVDPGENTAAQINQTLASATTFTGTPTTEMLTTLKSYQGLKDTTRPNYIVLFTDGGSNCAANPQNVVDELYKQTPPVKTFAVGFDLSSAQNSADAMAELNAIAQAGQTAIAGGPPYYYVATDATSLANAFSSIAGSVQSCTYQLSTTPPDITKLYVYQNQVAVARDTSKTNGWDYDSTTNQITFYGAACTALKSGSVSSLSIVYGCPQTIQ